MEDVMNPVSFIKKKMKKAVVPVVAGAAAVVASVVVVALVTNSHRIFVDCCFVLHFLELTFEEQVAGVKNCIIF